MDVIPLDQTRLRLAATSFAKAFFDYPLYQCYFTREWREHNFVDYAEFGISVGMHIGQVFTTAEGSGVSLWLTPNKLQVTAWDWIREGAVVWLLRMGWKSYSMQMVCEDNIAKVHHALLPEPHWYLWGVAVNPECQGQGIGSKLMQPGLDRADQQHLPCYLETHDPKNIPYYQKRGFKMVREEIISAINLPIWCFIRKAR